MIKFTVKETQYNQCDPNEEIKDVDLNLTVFKDGDVGLFASDECTSVPILYLNTTGEISLNILNVETLKKLGFCTDKNHIAIQNV